MKIAVQIPVKGRSSKRIPNKNFTELCGKPLAFWLLDEIVANIPDDWDLFIDSEKETTMDQIKERYGNKFLFHKRNEWFAMDHANGNHLITQFAFTHPQYDIYVQLFVTAVTLSGEVVIEAVKILKNSLDKHDSLLLVTEETGWFWFNGKALNYNPTIPDGLPRSQDAMAFKETTGLYAITKDAVFKTCCRIGENPIFYKVPHEFSMDIDTMEDLEEAKQLFSSRKNND